MFVYRLPVSEMMNGLSGYRVLIATRTAFRELVDGNRHGTFSA